MTVGWPGPVTLSAAEDGYTAIPSRSGAIIPSRWPEPIGRFFPVAGYRLGHPWWAVVRDDAAMIQFVETVYDAAVRIRHEPGEGTDVELFWQPCWGLMRYPRQVRFRVQPGGSHLSAAKWYRQRLIDEGKLVPLEKRTAAMPQLRKLRGAIFMPVKTSSYRRGGSYTVQNSFDAATHEVRRLRGEGIDHLYLMLRYISGDLGHNVEPTIYPPSEPAGGWAGLRRVKQACQEAGYLFGYYDCLRLYFLASRAYREADAAKNASGLAAKLDIYGGPMAWTAPKFYERFFREGVGAMREHGTAPDVYYFDMLIGDRMEDYDPRHATTRYEAARCILRCLRAAREMGMIVRVEGESYIGLAETDLPHWSPTPDFGVPVPLTHLALHDAMVFPGWLRDFRYWQHRQLASSGQAVTCVLFGEAPMLMRNTLPFSSKNLEWARFAAKVHRAIGFAEMTGHRFLADDCSRQETTFAGGVRIVGDYDRMTVEVQGIEGIDPAPIRVVPFGYRIYPAVDSFRRIDDETFELTIRWESPDSPEEPVQCSVHPKPVGNHYVEPSYKHVIEPEDWTAGDGTVRTPPMRFKLPPRMREGTLNLNFSLKVPGTKRFVYFEGMKSGTATRTIGRFIVTPDGKERSLKYCPVPLEEGGRWLPTAREMLAD